MRHRERLSRNDVGSSDNLAAIAHLLMLVIIRSAQDIAAVVHKNLEIAI